MSNKLKYSLLALLLTATAALGGDLLIKTRGDIIFKSTSGSVKLNSPVRVNSIGGISGVGPTLGGVPVGGVVAVVPNLHANLWQPPATGVVKDGFMRADGNSVPGGCTDCKIPPLTTLPNMVGKYVKGGTTTSGTTTTVSDLTITAAQMPQFSFTNNATTGMVDITGNTPVTHNHNIDHTHSVSNTTTTHAHAQTHSHGIDFNTDGGHAHSVTLPGTVGSHSHQLNGPDGHTLAMDAGTGTVVTFQFAQATTNSATYNGPWVAWWDGGHTHSINTAGITADHRHYANLSSTTPGINPSTGTHTHTITNYTTGQSGAISQEHNHTFGSIAIGSASPTAARSPYDIAKSEVVWVIRVK